MDEYEVGGGDDKSKKNGADEVTFEDRAMSKDTLRFICKVLDTVTLDKDTTSVCFCEGCAALFNSVMELYQKLSPLLDKIRTNVMSKSKGNLEPSTSSASSSPCGEIEDGDDGDTTVKPEDMEQDEFYEESNCDEEEEWSEDSLLDEVKSEQEEEDDEELSDDVEDDEEDGIDIPENDPLEGVGDHAASKPVSYINAITTGKYRLLWPMKYPCAFCHTRYKSNDPYLWWAHVLKHHRKNLKYCAECNAHFLSDALFQAHLVLHHVNRDPGLPVSCLICHETVQPTELRQHLLFQHPVVPKSKPEQSHSCDVCGKCFSWSWSLKKHAQIHLDTEQRRLNCEFCSKSFLNKPNFALHLLEEHEGDSSLEKKFKCSSCGKLFLSSCTLERHELFHQRFDKSGRTLKCEICEFPFLPKEQEKLLKHIDEIHKKKKANHPLVKCAVEGCEFQRSKFGEIKRHERKEHPDLFIHDCKQCEKSYSAANFLETHLRTHSDVGPFHCKICSGVVNFQNGQALSHHLARHNGEETFQCDECPKTFAENSNLKAHKIASHDADSPYMCDKCGRKCTNMAMLKEHKNKSHPSKDGPKFPCSVCSRIYNTKTQLSNHIKNTHEQRDRSVYCEFCGVKAKDPHYLKLHILRKHQPKEFEKAKKHDCSYCGKKFFTIFEVNQHVLTHTGERPFVCHICQKGFTQKHCLNGHMKSHKKDGTYFPNAATSEDRRIKYNKISDTASLSP